MQHVNIHSVLARIAVGARGRMDVPWKWSRLMACASPTNGPAPDLHFVLLHGYVGDGPTTWRPQIEGLCDQFTVVAWDAPGCGGSSELGRRQKAHQDKHRNKARAHKKDLEGAVPDNPAGKESAAIRAGRHVWR